MAILNSIERARAASSPQTLAPLLLDLRQKKGDICPAMAAFLQLVFVLPSLQWPRSHEVEDHPSNEYAIFMAKERGIVSSLQVYMYNGDLDHCLAVPSSSDGTRSLALEIVHSDNRGIPLVQTSGATFSTCVSAPTVLRSTSEVSIAASSPCRDRAATFSPMVCMIR